MDVSLTTVIFEVINFLILVWLLRKILYEPLRRALRERQRELEEERGGALAAREEAEALHAEAVEERDRLRQLRQQMHAEMRQEVDRDRQELLQQAHEEADARRAHAEARLEEERERLQREAEALAIEQSAMLAGQILARLSPEALHDALTDAVCATLERAPAAELFHGDIPSSVQVATARPLAGATLDRIQRALEPKVGGRVAVSQVPDDELIAGVVVRAGDQVIDGSARNQLEAFQRLARQHLAHENQAHEHLEHENPADENPADENPAHENREASP